MKPAIVFGTRPEVIKIAPIVHQLQAEGMDFDLVRMTQHKDLVDPLIKLLELPKPLEFGVWGKIHRYDAERLAETIRHAMVDLTAYFHREDVCAVVQGDTSTAFAAALAAYYNDRPIVHVEAGLRTYQKNPWPEEAHRRMITAIATVNCAPTAISQTELKCENAVGEVHCTGNTVIDAVLWMSDRIDRGSQYDEFYEKYPMFKRPGYRVLITGHRRENLQGRLLDYARSLRDAAKARPEDQFIWSVHPNPSVMVAIQESGFGSLRNVHILPPIQYDEFVWMMRQSTLIVTDSGGIVEEASALEKPVIITRDCTERSEAVVDKLAVLAEDPKALKWLVTSSLDSATFLDWWKPKRNVFGDGNAAKRIVAILKDLCQ